MLSKKAILFLIIGIFTAVSATAQDTPSDVRDLVGARASSGESQLRRRGYDFVKTTEGSDRKWSNWWKQSTRTCITVATVEGRYDSITTSPAFDCNRNQGGGGGGGNAPNWAVGTFYGTNPQSGGTITLNISGDGSVTITFENGATEYATITNQRMNHNGVISRISRLSNGIRTTRIDNGERIDYYTNNNNNNNGGGRKVDVSDLVGVRASSGEAEMRSRGFRLVDSLKSGSTSYTIWWRQPSRQCIQVAVADGRYDSLTDIGTHPKCR